MDNHSAFQVVTIVQLFLINLVIPWFGLRKSMGGVKAFKSNFGFANLFVIGCGIPFVLLVFSPNLFEKTQTQLAGLGALFAVQMMPVLLFKKNFETNLVTGEDDIRHTIPIGRISQIVTAIFASSIMIIAYFTRIDGGGMWLKLAVFSSACTLLYLLSKRALSADKSENGNDGINKARNLLIMIALLSIYWALKEVLFATNSHELRPIVMSIFMQVTALITLPSVVNQALYAQNSKSFQTLD